MKTTVTLHLREGHCIETTAKRRREKLVEAMLADALVDDDPLPEDEAELELLTAFVKMGRRYFSDLRANRPELDGSRDITVEVSSSEEGTFDIEEA